jgi:hypothetical protein
MSQYEVLDFLRKHQHLDYVSSSYIKRRMNNKGVFRMIRSLERAGFVKVRCLLRQDGRVEKIVSIIKDVEEL